MLKHIAIKHSNIHGLGVFAEEDIGVGEIIIDWSGCTEVLNKQEIQRLPDDERKNLSYIDGQYILFKPPARFVNHSCNPNARGAKGYDVAIRHVARGEEITVDYVIEQVPGLNFECKCGTSSCRGFLTIPAQAEHGPENSL